MSPRVIWHPARGCVRFRCPCGRLLTWPVKAHGKRIPEAKRDKRCECGVLHTR